MTDREPRDGVSVRAVALLGASVVALWAVAWILLVILVPKPEERGLFGDMFGSVNALFSGLALAGVVLTLFMQHRELGLQREELQLTRNQLKKTTDAQEASGESLARQAVANERAAVIAGLVAVVDHFAIRIKVEGNAHKKLDLEAERTTHMDQLAGMVKQGPVQL